MLMQRLRKIALVGAYLANAASATISLRLLKTGAVIVRHAHRVRIMLALFHQQRHTILIAACAGSMKPNAGFADSESIWNGAGEISRLVRVSGITPTVQLQQGFIIAVGKVFRFWRNGQPVGRDQQLLLA